ncbi:HlyD family secretion protein [Pseudomonas gingeri]|uniref:HlyD family secretion protein n=1 Tax=Pseudomonas gingeri TaxID=117681 RepID=A0A7Y7YAI3_9PSED|nr:HlyD family secretion protein [Pseudomonas gingeri]NVZ99023.1 HlyD family secretion protein [Pseudomonas gingeri]NWA13068.1 HlyD family secretion protein [Pseudomonas gingeri]NWA55329.1 HlyD family secretion protein [Pseudomonas gingeri]NWA95817.1 HlyD family secretion protein [Pseudomonas gingeri]NWB00905.1 HlyD family secretion protein [Pseudomonas gingeri]
MKPRLSLSLVGGAVLLAVVYTGYHLLHSDGAQSTDDARISADSVLIAPQIAGVVSNVAVADNQPVKAGQLLLEIDARDYQAAQAAAIAAVNAAQAQVKNLAAELERQATLITQADATLRSTAASLRFAEANAQRYRNLSSAGAGTREEQQKSAADLTRWQAARDHDAAARLEQQKNQDVLKARLEMAEAAVQQAHATLVQADLNVSYTHVVAPRDGVIGQRSVRVGAYVAPGKAVMAVVPVSDAYVVANFRETQLTHMRPDQAVDIAIDSFPDRTYRGHIDSLAPATGLSFSAIAPDNATGNFTKVVQRIPVKIVFDHDQPGLDGLRVGMSVVARVITQGSL